MIETVMTFALGVLAAGFAALLMLPILNRRSARLARRRIEGMFPTSMQEIAAERDALRAEAAIAQRRMERLVDVARDSAGADKRKAGARVLEIAALQRVVASRDDALDARKAEIDEALARIAGLDRDLSDARSEGTASLGALTALEEAHHEILAELKAVRRERDGIRRDLDDAEERVGPNGSSATGPASSDTDAGTATDPLTDLRQRNATLAAERNGLQASLRAAEDALAEVLAEGGVRNGRNDAELRDRIMEVAEALAGRDRLPTVGVFPLPVASRP